MAFHPYLFFGGICREAFTLYQQVFGGELTLITIADMPEQDRMPGARDDLIMHAALKSGDELLMGSDDPTTESFGPVQGMMVTHTADDVDEAKRIFAALAEGGQETLAIGPTSFSKMFGMCVDRFGTPWMVDTADPDS